MHTEFARYLASLRLLEQLRWALAGCLMFGATRLVKVSARLLPEHHPARPYLSARVEAGERTIVPAVNTGLPAWAKQLGRGLLVLTLAAPLFLMFIVATHSI